MKHPGNAALFDHWHSIRHGRHVPDRNDLDPVAIRTVLAFTFMLEVDGHRPAARSYPVRVSGTRLDALFGRDVKDESFTDFWMPHHAGEVRTIMETVSDDGTPAVVGVLAAPRGFDPVPAELLMLPLRCRGRSNGRLICSLAPLATPPWLGLAGVAPLGLSTWRTIDTANLSNPTSRTPATVTSIAAPEARRRRFKVVEGGRAGEPPRLDHSQQAHVNGTVPGSDTVVLSFQAP